MYFFTVFLFFREDDIYGGDGLIMARPTRMARPRKLHPPDIPPPPSRGTVDLLGSILDGQDMLNSIRSVTVTRTGDVVKMPQKTIVKSKPHRNIVKDNTQHNGLSRPEINSSQKTPNLPNTKVITEIDFNENANNYVNKAPSLTNNNSGGSGQQGPGNSDNTGGGNDEFSYDPSSPTADEFADGPFNYFADDDGGEEDKGIMPQQFIPDRLEEVLRRQRAEQEKALEDEEGRGLYDVQPGEHDGLPMRSPPSPTDSDNDSNVAPLAPPPMPAFGSNLAPPPLPNFPGFDLPSSAENSGSRDVDLRFSSNAGMETPFGQAFEGADRDDRIALDTGVDTDERFPFENRNLDDVSREGEHDVSESHGDTDFRMGGEMQLSGPFGNLEESNEAVEEFSKDTSQESEENIDEDIDGIPLPEDSNDGESTDTGADGPIRFSLKKGNVKGISELLQMRQPTNAESSEDLDGIPMPDENEESPNVDVKPLIPENIPLPSVETIPMPSSETIALNMLDTESIPMPKSPESIPMPDTESVSLSEPDSIPLPPSDPIPMSGGDFPLHIPLPSGPLSSATNGKIPGLGEDLEDIPMPSEPVETTEGSDYEIEEVDENNAASGIGSLLSRLTGVAPKPHKIKRPKSGLSKSTAIDVESEVVDTQEVNENTDQDESPRVIAEKELVDIEKETDNESELNKTNDDVDILVERTEDIDSPDEFEVISHQTIDGLEVETVSESEELEFSDPPSNAEEGEIFDAQNKDKQGKSGNKGKPGEFEEGEIVDDKRKKKKAKKQKNKSKGVSSKENMAKSTRPASPALSEISKDGDLPGDDDNLNTSRDSEIAEKTANIDPSEQEGVESSWKKPSKLTRDRNYRDGKPGEGSQDKPSDKDWTRDIQIEHDNPWERSTRDRDMRREREEIIVVEDYDKRKEKRQQILDYDNRREDYDKRRDKRPDFDDYDKRRDKRQEIERYDVRRLIKDRKKGDKERPNKDEFGREIRGRRSHSSEFYKSRRRRFSRSMSRSMSRSYSRSYSRSPSYSRSRSRKRKGGSRSRDRRGRLRSRSPSGNRFRSGSRGRKKKDKQMLPRPMIVHAYDSRSPTPVKTKRKQKGKDKYKKKHGSPDPLKRKKKKHKLSEGKFKSGKEKGKKKKKKSPTKEVFATDETIYVTMNFDRKKGKENRDGRKKTREEKSKKKKKGLSGGILPLSEKSQRKQKKRLNRSPSPRGIIPGIDREPLSVSPPRRLNSRMRSESPVLPPGLYTSGIGSLFAGSQVEPPRRRAPRPANPNLPIEIIDLRNEEERDGDSDESDIVVLQNDALLLPPGVRSRDSLGWHQPEPTSQNETENPNRPQDVDLRMLQNQNTESSPLRFSMSGRNIRDIDNPLASNDHMRGPRTPPEHNPANDSDEAYDPFEPTKSPTPSPERRPLQPPPIPNFALPHNDLVPSALFPLLPSSKEKTRDQDDRNVSVDDFGWSPNAHDKSNKRGHSPDEPRSSKREKRKKAKHRSPPIRSNWSESPERPIQEEIQFKKGRSKKGLRPRSPSPESVDRNEAMDVHNTSFDKNDSSVLDKSISDRIDIFASDDINDSNKQISDFTPNADSDSLSNSRLENRTSFENPSFTLNEESPSRRDGAETMVIDENRPSGRPPSPEPVSESPVAISPVRIQQSPTRSEPELVALVDEQSPVTASRSPDITLIDLESNRPPSPKESPVKAVNVAQPDSARKRKVEHRPFENGADSHEKTMHIPDLGIQSPYSPQQADDSDGGQPVGKSKIMSIFFGLNCNLIEVFFLSFEKLIG